LLGILASLGIVLGSGVGISLTATAPAADPPAAPEVVSALGAAPTTAPPASPSPSATPSPTPPATPSDPPPPPEPPDPPDPPAEEVDEITAQEDEVIALTNAERAAAGCGALGADDRLGAAARGHSQDMAANDYFDHTSLDGRSPFDRMADAGYPDPAGENIAVGYRTPADVMEGWMNSEGHRDNLLNCSHQAIGVGLAYDGGGRPYWTQDFGR
jgi:uncharacterized protein YkwD